MANSDDYAKRVQARQMRAIMDRSNTATWVCGIVGGAIIGVPVSETPRV